MIRNGANRSWHIKFFSVILLLVILLGQPLSIILAAPASFFDTDLAQGKSRFRQVVNESTNNTAVFYELSISSSSGNIFTVPGDDGISTAYVRATKDGVAINFNSLYSSQYYHGWSVGVSNWQDVIDEGVKFEFFADSGLTIPLPVNAFGVQTQDWGTCCMGPNNTPTGTAYGTAIYTIFDGGTAGQSIDLLGNITTTISSTVHFVAEIDDRDETFTEVTVAPNGNGEYFMMGGYMLFSIVPEDSVPPGSGSTPSIPPERPDLTAATDLGTSNSDNLTSDTTPDFSVTYTPQNEIDFVNLYDGSTLIATSAAAGTTNETTVTLTSALLGEGTHVITAKVENGYWHDESDASPSLTITIDATPPTMTITAAEVSDGDTSNDPTLSLTFSSSESTTTFNAGDVSVTNGSLSGFSGSGTTYTATFTPIADGDVTINVAAGAYSDSAGNDNLAADEFNWTSDQTPPTVEFNPPDGATIVANSADIILTLSEPIRRSSDNVELTDTNIDAHITLKYDDATGLDVPFDATIDSAKKVITINPTSPLPSNQNFYVSIGTSVEDYANNALADSNATFMSADENLPTLSGSSPSDGLTGVNINTDLILYFSEPVFAQSGNIEIRHSSDNSLFESIIVTGGQVSGDGTDTITADITGPLASLTDYYVLIDGTAFDDADSNSYQGIVSPSTLNFTTQYIDLIAPIGTFNPADGSSGVAVNSNITLTFDEAVRNLDDSALTDSNVDALITLKDTNASGSDIPFDATIDVAKEVITINPTSNFTSEQVVYVAIGATVEDASNNAITETNATFTVEDVLAPTILSTNPVDEATLVDVNQDLVITFSEPVDVEFGTIKIYKSSDNSVFESMSVTSITQVSGSGTSIITVNPSNTLDFLTSYYIQIDSTAFDDPSGNSFAGIADTTTWNFTTGTSNDPPTANDDAVSTDEDTAFTTIDLVADNDTDPNPGDTLTVTGIDTTGTTGLVTDNGDGTFDYDPNGQFDSLAAGESATDSFEYTISDGNGGSDSATVTVTINGVNEAPTANDDAVSTDEDTAFTTIDLVADNDTDPNPGDTLTVTGIDTTATTGLVTDNGDGTFDYNPNSQFDSLAVGESTTDSFEYTISDGNGGSDSATVTVTISGVNDAPIANDDSDTTQEDSAVTVDVLNNDDHVDNGDSISIISVTQGSHGTVTNTVNDVTYDPDPNYFGTDTFTYTVEDSLGVTDAATVTITVTETDDLFILGNSQVIVNGDNTPSTTDDTDFGTTALFLGTVEHAFTIENRGSIDIFLTGSPLVSVGGAHASDFTVTTQPISPIASGESTIFIVEFDPSEVGIRTAEISIAYDDSADPYIFAVQGTASANDSDNDGVEDNVEGGGDRDGDGVPNYQDYDPTGYFYDRSDGKIISGGLISVTGPGLVTIVQNGENGYYQFVTDGTSGTYTITVSLPPGYTWSKSCLRRDPPAFDPTGQAEPVVLGNGENGSTGYLTSNACTRFYLSFDLEPGDPAIFNNNFPLYLRPLPDTGFIPGQMTVLDMQPTEKLYQYLGGMRLEIPAINVVTELIGVPAVNGEWDVSWLGNSAGYLSGTAFPTWKGNTVITGHVWNAYNQPSVFVNLKELTYGDLIKIYAWGQVYTYKVQNNRLVSPYTPKSLLESKDLDWVTIFTCEDYQPFRESYIYRRMVEAVLINIRAAD